MAYLLAGFDIARIGPCTLAGSDAGGAWSVPLTEGTLAHRALTSVTGTGTYAALGATLETLVNAASSSGTYAFTWAAATGYTITNDTGNFSLTFTGSAVAERMGTLLGFSANLSGDDSYTSTRTPHYYLALAKAGPSGYSRDYEVSGQTKRQVSANGRAFSIGPRTYEKRIKFSLGFQSLATVFADEATASVPWTYEALVQHARAHQPILLSYVAEDLVYKLVKADFDEDARSSVFNDYHGLWDLKVEAQPLGRL